VNINSLYDAGPSLDTTTTTSDCGTVDGKAEKEAHLAQLAQNSIARRKPISLP
jgi:hypothetical protein